MSTASPIYRHGTIGRAKNHLEATTRELTESLHTRHGGRALTSVNGAAVTQASTAIPGISLYVSLLHATLGNAMQSPVAQGMRLWSHVSGKQPLPIDDQGRIRLDDWELGEDVQADVERTWNDAVVAGLLPEGVSEWFMDELHRLYGFAEPGVDYTPPVEVDVPWPEQP